MNESYERKLDTSSKGNQEPDPAMQRHGEELKRMQSLLRETAAADAAAAVQPFVAERVMRQIAAERTARHVQPQEDLWVWLSIVFRPIAAVCLLLVTVLAAHNLYLSSQFEARQSPVEAVLALPEVTMAVAIDLDVTSLHALEQQ